MLRSWHETQKFDENGQNLNWATEASFFRRNTRDTALEPQRSKFLSYKHPKYVHTSGTQMAQAKME